MRAEPLEVEVKVRFDGPESARRAILAAGGVQTRARHFEENVVFDTPARDLASRRALLRLRSTSDGKAVVTFKEKVEADFKAKVRIEHEVIVSDASTTAAIFEKTGLVVTYRYQKHRTVFSVGAATVDLDETPMGCFLEIEGTREAIAGAAGRLGLGEDDFIVEDYRALYQAWREERGLPPADMVFEEGSAGGPALG